MLVVSGRILGTWGCSQAVLGPVLAIPSSPAARWKNVVRRGVLGCLKVRQLVACEQPALGGPQNERFG